MENTTPAELARRRYLAVGLGSVEALEPADVVRRLGALQAQDFGPAKWSIGQRTGASDAVIEAQFNEGRIVRTHLMRPTWHFVHPADLRWLLELTAPRVHQVNGFMYRQEGLDDRTRNRSEELVRNALADRQYLTRTELAEVLRTAGILAERFRLAYLLMSAELNGVICSGPRRGNEHTYALLEERVPIAENLTTEEGLAELTFRYFSSHGPATAKDFGWWSGLTQAAIKRGLESVAERLVREEISENVYWSTPERLDDRTGRPSDGPDLALLQGYDEYIVGYSESKKLLDLARYSERGIRVPFNGVVLVDGQVAGHWKKTAKPALVSVEVALYERPDQATTSAMEEAVSQHGRFLERPTALTWSVL